MFLLFSDAFHSRPRRVGLDGCDDLKARVDYLVGFDYDTAPCDICTLSRGKECTLGGSYGCSDTYYDILSVLKYLGVFPMVTNALRFSIRYTVSHTDWF
jgi:hypothetical protein